MTVINTINKTDRVQGNGIITDFDFTFKIFNDTDLLVYKINRTTEVATLQTLGVDYTISIETVSEGGTISYAVAPTANEDSFGIRALPRTQGLDIPSLTALNETQLENAYDKSIMVSQELGEIDGRCLKFSQTSGIEDIEMPTPEDRKSLIWDGIDGTIKNSIIEIEDIQDSLDEAAASASNSAASASSAAASATNASNSSTSASNSATAAANSATEAAANVGNFESALVDIKTDNYTVVDADRSKLLIMNSATPRAFTLFDIVGNEVVILKNIGSADCTITPDGSDTTEIATLKTDEVVILCGDGTNNKWRAISFTGEESATTPTYIEVRLTGDIAGPITTEKIVIYDTVVVDTLGEYNNTTGLFTLENAGLYIFSGNIGFGNATVNQSFQVRPKLNSVTVEAARRDMRCHFTTAGEFDYPFSFITRTTAPNDTVEVFVRSNDSDAFIDAIGTVSNPITQLQCSRIL